MIIIRRCIIFILIVLACTIYCQDAYAIIAFQKTDKEHKSLLSVVGISVNSKGEIAIGFRDNHINIYDDNGNFINGYTFKTSGSYRFKYDEYDNIMIFAVRSGICYFLNSAAELIKTREFSNSTEESKYLRSLEEGNKKISINGNLYEVKNPFGYTKLIKTEANGEMTIIYDIGWFYAGKIAISLLELLFVIIVLMMIRKEIIKARGNNIVL